MELNFIGRGAAFNPKEGNNSAYFSEDKRLFLIDCGESIFERIVEYNLLDNIDEVNLMITHTHSDHIGSIGSLVSYCFYKLNIKLNIIIPSNAKYKDNIETILRCFGCPDSMYNFINEINYDNKYSAFNTIRFIETTHCKDLDCYGIIFETNKGIIYYSGDTCETRIILDLINKNKVIDKIYIDSTTDDYQGNVHLNIDKLNNDVPHEIKNKIYCMHINNDDCFTRAKKLGFNVVDIKKGR